MAEETQYKPYKTQVNAETYYEVLPWAGNVPFGYTPISQEEFTQARESQLASDPNRWKPYYAQQQGYIDKMMKGMGTGYQMINGVPMTTKGLEEQKAIEAGVQAGTWKNIGTAEKPMYVPTGSPGAKLAEGVASGQVSPTNPMQQYQASLGGDISKAQQAGQVPIVPSAPTMGAAPVGGAIGGATMATTPPAPTQEDYKKGFEALSGTAAPESAGAAKAMMAAATPITRQATGGGLMTLLEQDLGWQQLMADRAEYNSIANQSKSLVETYQEMVKQANIPAINADLINMKSVIDGTEDDIRNEVKAAGGMATESQVLALTSARNKQLIKNYNRLVDEKAMAMESINNMIGLAAQDREFAMNAAMQKLQIDQQMLEYRDRFVQNAREGYQNIINAVGYGGLYSMLESDPQSLALAEQTMGLGPGMLEDMSIRQQRAANLAKLSEYDITSRFIVNPQGEVQDTQTGRAFSSEDEFFDATGFKNWDEAYRSGSLKQLGMTREQEKEQFKRQIDLAKLDIDLQQLDISRYTAQTARMNALNPSTTLVDMGDGQKALVTYDRHGNLVNQQMINTPLSINNAIRQIIEQNPDNPATGTGWGTAANQIEQLLGRKIVKGSEEDKLLVNHYGNKQPLDYLLPQTVDEKTVAQARQMPEYKTIEGLVPAILALKNYREAIEKHGSWEFTGTGKGELESTYGNAISAWKTLATLGALSGADFSLAEQAVPKPGLWVNNKTMLGKINSSLDNAIQQAEVLSQRITTAYPKSQPLFEDQQKQMLVLAYPNKYRIDEFGQLYEKGE